MGYIAHLERMGIINIFDIVDDTIILAQILKYGMLWMIYILNISTLKKKTHLFLLLISDHFSWLDDSTTS